MKVTFKAGPKPFRAVAREFVFHTTSMANIESIAEAGLEPARGGRTFSWGAYGSQSRGKVFAARGPQAARSWFSKVGDVLESSSDDLVDRVPVMLRFPAPPDLQVDPLGEADVPGSRFTTRRVAADVIEAFHPKRGWVPVTELDPDDARLGATLEDDDGETYWSVNAPYQRKPAFTPEGRGDRAFGRRTSQSNVDRWKAKQRRARQAFLRKKAEAARSAREAYVPGSKAVLPTRRQGFFDGKAGKPPAFPPIPKNKLYLQGYAAGRRKREQDA